jgi:hypothetical protein
MATLGTVYDAEPAVRGVDDVIADPDRAGGDVDPERRKGPKARSKWLCGSVEDTAADVVAAVFDQAESRDPEHARTRVALVDGAPHQIDLINEQAAARAVPVAYLTNKAEYLRALRHRTRARLADRDGESSRAPVDTW